MVYFYSRILGHCLKYLVIYAKKVTFLSLKKDQMRKRVCGVLISVKKVKGGMSAYTHPPTIIYVLDYAQIVAGKTPRQKVVVGDTVYLLGEKEIVGLGRMEDILLYVYPLYSFEFLNIST